MLTPQLSGQNLPLVDKPVELPTLTKWNRYRYSVCTALQQSGRIDGKRLEGTVRIHDDKKVNRFTVAHFDGAARLVSKSFIAGIGLLGLSGLLFLFILEFGKPFIPNCYRCDFTEWDSLTNSNNHVWFFFDGLLAVSGTALLIGYRLDNRSKKVKTNQI